VVNTVEIAAFIQGISREIGNKPVSKTRMGKLLYFVQIRHQEAYGEKLMPCVQAWQWGPIVPFDEWNDVPYSLELNDPKARESVLTVMLEMGNVETTVLSDISHDIGPWELYDQEGINGIIIPDEDLEDAWTQSVVALRSSDTIEVYNDIATKENRLMELYNA